MEIPSLDNLFLIVFLFLSTVRKVRVLPSLSFPIYLHKFNNEAGNHVDECKLRPDYVVLSDLEESEEETSENTAAVSPLRVHQVTSTKVFFCGIYVIYVFF